MSNPFSIEDANVIQILTDVPIKEQVFMENSIMSLNKEQIKIEMTNLLYELYKNNVGKHVDLFEKLFASKARVDFDSLLPAVTYRQYAYYDDPEFNPDEQIEDATQVKYVPLQDFLAQLRSILKSKDMNYEATMARLGKFLQPFTTLEGVEGARELKAARDTESVRMFFDRRRPMRLLENEVVQMVGHFNVVHPYKLDVHETFDVMEYVQQLHDVKEGERVHVVFNDFVFHGKKVIGNAEGVVKKKRGSKITVDVRQGDNVSTLSIDLENMSNHAYVYSKEYAGTRYTYKMKDLMTKNILFKNLGDHKAFVLPQTPSQILYVLNNDDDMHLNIQSINAILHKYVDINDLPSSFGDIIKALVSRRYPPLIHSRNIAFSQTRPIQTAFLKHAEVPHHFKDTYIDTDVLRFKHLHASFHKEYAYMLQRLQKYVKRLQKSASSHQYMLKGEQDKLMKALATAARSSSETSNASPLKQFMFSKIYESLDELTSDNNKVIYFDKDLDPTQYGFKTKLEAYDDVEARLRDELSKLYKSRDLEFEVRSIMKGRRKVREGDHCVLVTPFYDYVYVRRKVEGQYAWIKITKLPFKFCKDDVALYTNMIQEDMHVFDYYDQTCKNLKNVIENTKFNLLKQKLSYIEEALHMHENIDDVREVLESDIQQHITMCMFGKRCGSAGETDSQFLAKLDDDSYMPSVADFVRLANITSRREDDAFIKKMQDDTYQPSMDDMVRFHALTTEREREREALKLSGVDVDVDYDEYEGDISEGEEDDLRLVFADQDHYETMRDDGEVRKRDVLLEDVSPIREVIDILNAFMGISFEPSDYEYLEHYISQQDKCVMSKDEIQQRLAVKKKELRKSINQKLYDTNEEYRKKADVLVEKKLDELNTQLVSDLYYNISVSCIACLTLYIMVKYPETTIKDIYPSCVKMMSYFGYPLVETASQRTLTKYVTCILKNIISPNDVRFTKLGALSVDDIYTQVVKKIDAILKEDGQLKLRVELNKPRLKAGFSKGDSDDEDAYAHTMTGFLPTFDFEDKRTSHPIVKYLKTLNTIIKSSKHLRVSALHLPLLMNACCLEQLSPNMSYYSFFESHTKASEYAQHKKDLKVKGTRPNAYARPPFKALLQRMHADVKTKEEVLQFQKMHHVTYQVSQEDNATMQDVATLEKFIERNEGLKDDIMWQGIADAYDQEDFWDETVYSRIVSLSDMITAFVKSNASLQNNQYLDLFKNTIVLLSDFGAVSDIKHVMLTFMKNTIRKVLANIAHRVKVEDAKKNGDEPPKVEDLSTMMKVRIAFLRNTAVDTSFLKEVAVKYLQGLELLEFAGDDVKTFAVLQYVFLMSLYSILVGGIVGQLDHGGEVDDALLIEISLTSTGLQKQKASLYADLVYLLIEQLITIVTENMIQTSAVSKKVEELREKKKESLMAMYKADDEERQLQMVLKKIGVDSWHDVGTEADEYVDMAAGVWQGQDISKVQNQREEDENYKIGDYPGENGDADEYAEDYPSQFVFESVRD